MARKSRKRLMKSSPTRSAKIAVKPSSTGWFDLPLEMREIVIDEMDPKTRCKFTQCSKWCEYESKKSKNYFYKIGLDSNDKNEVQLLLGHTKNSEDDYWYEFVEVGENQTTVFYKCGTDSESTVKWTKVETGEPKDLRWKYFNEYMEKYNRSIKAFVFYDNHISATEFNIKSLRSLEKLSFFPGPSVSAINDGVNLVECGFIEMKQLACFKYLYAPNCKLTFDQIAELKAGFIRVKSDEFNEANINKYLKMTKKGEIYENTKKVHIGIGNGNTFENIENVVNGLDIFKYYEVHPILQHEHEIDRSRTTYHFKFLSDVKKSGDFKVFLRPCESLEVFWGSRFQIV